MTAKSRLRYNNSMAEKTYRQLQTELDEAMAKLQADDLDVDEALELYDQASKLISQLQKKLKQAENKLNKIKS